MRNKLLLCKKYGLKEMRVIVVVNEKQHLMKNTYISVYKCINNTYYIMPPKWYIICMSFLYLPLSYKDCVYLKFKV